MSACVTFVPDQSSSSGGNSSSSVRQLCLTLSEDGRFFVVGTRDGFVVYCTEPFVPLTVREVANGGVSLVSMFARSNLLLLVSPGRPKTALIWNEASSPPAAIGEASFHTDIVAVRLHQAMMLVADSNAVHVFSPKMVCVHSVEYNAASRIAGLPALAIPGSGVCTFFSGSGMDGLSNNNNNNSVFQHRQAMMNLRNSTATTPGSSSASFHHHQQQQQQQQQRSDVSFSSGSSASLSRGGAQTMFPVALPCPSTSGSVLFLHFDVTPKTTAASSATRKTTGGREDDDGEGATMSSPNTKLRIVHRRSVAVHNKPLGVVAFCPNGRFVASCSTGGTAIKLTHVQSGNVLLQFNRGATPNQIHSIAFSNGMSYLSCVSSTGSVHLFAIVNKVQEVLSQLGDGDDMIAGSSDSNGNPVAAAAAATTRNAAGGDDDEDLSNRHLGGAAAAAAAAQNEATGTRGGGVVDSKSPLSQVSKQASRNVGFLGFMRTMLQTTASFHDGVWSCGHFDMLQLAQQPSAAKRALFGPAVAGFLDGVEDDGSLRFFVAHGESGKIGKVRFEPNPKTAQVLEAAAAGVSNSNTNNNNNGFLGGRNAAATLTSGIVQSGNAAAVQAPMGTCELIHSYNFPTEWF